MVLSQFFVIGKKINKIMDFFIKIKQILKYTINLFSNKSNQITIDKDIFIPFKRDDEIRILYKKSLIKSNLEWSDNFYKQLRYYSLHQMALFVASNSNLRKFNIAECGVWKGQSAYIISSIFKKYNFRKSFDIFDSFEGGLSKKSIHDKNLNRVLTSKEVQHESSLFSSTMDEVQKCLKEFNFIKLYPGWIPECFNDTKNREYSFVHLDVDLFEPTYDSLVYFWNKVVDGGVIVVDDYGSSQFPGATKAVDNFLISKKYKFFYKVPMGGCFIFK